MAELETPFPTGDRHQLELRAVTEIERLPGAIAAAVWLEHDRRLRDLCITTVAGASQPILVNAASRVLQSLGIPYDPRHIRTRAVATGDEAPPAAVLPAATQGGSARFLLLQDISISRSGTHVTCRVQVAHDDSVSSGEARELDSLAGRARAAATATLRAAETAAGNVAFGLEGATVNPLFGRDYALVSVEAALGRRVAHLSGCVAVDPARSTEESVCLATLRAIDRWLGL